MVRLPVTANSHYHEDMEYGLDPECPFCQSMTVGRMNMRTYTKATGNTFVDPRDINRYGRMNALEWLEMRVGVQQGSTAAVAKEAALAGLFEALPLTDDQVARLTFLQEQIAGRLETERMLRERHSSLVRALEGW